MNKNKYIYINELSTRAIWPLEDHRLETYDCHQKTLQSVKRQRDQSPGNL